MIKITLFLALLVAVTANDDPLDILSTGMNKIRFCDYNTRDFYEVRILIYHRPWSVQLMYSSRQQSGMLLRQYQVYKWSHISWLWRNWAHTKWLHANPKRARQWAIISVVIVEWNKLYNLYLLLSEFVEQFDKFGPSDYCSVCCGLNSESTKCCTGVRVCSCTRTLAPSCLAH